MRFFTLLTACLPAFALAGPTANPVPISSPSEFNEDALMEAFARSIMKRTSNPEPMSQASVEMEMASLIAARQLDLGNLSGLLSNLTSSFGAISQLLSPTSLGNINEVVSDLSALLKAPTTSDLKKLLKTASDLLNSDSFSSLIQSLPTLIGSVTGLLTPKLITNVTDILGGAHDLLSPQFISQTKGLIADVAPLVSAISQVISALLAAVFGTH